MSFMFGQSTMPTPTARNPDLEDEGDSGAAGWQLKKLKPVHMKIASLMAQGMKYVEIAQICAVTPEYISMLSRQPLIKQYVMQISEAAGLRLEALTEKTVDVIAETLAKGTEANKLKAVRLHGELTKRIGRGDMAPRDAGESVDRLERLAERLLFLQGGAGRRPPGVYDEAGEKIEEAEFRELGSGSGTAQAGSDG